MPSDVSPALEPLYTFAHWFLGSVLQTKTLADVAAEKDISSPQDPWNTLAAEWKYWASYWAGFLILSCLGVLYIIIVPLTGITVCSCRVCCKNCRPGAKKASTCKKVCCSAWLLMITVLIVFGVVWSILANVAIHNETKADSGAIDKIIDSVQMIEDYTKDTIFEIEDLINGEFSNAKDKLFWILDNGGSLAVDVLGNITNALPLLGKLKDFSDNLPELKLALEEAESSTQHLQASGAALKSELALLKQAILANISTCSGTVPECQHVESIAANLDMKVDYSALNRTQLTLSLEAVNTVIAEDLENEVQSSLQRFLSLDDVINSLLDQEIEQIKSLIDELEEELAEYVSLFADTISGAVDFDRVIASLAQTKPAVEDYGTYWFATCLTLSLLLAGIAVLYGCGLALGTCCRPGASMAAGRCLWAANIGAFLFGWVLMMLTTACFLLGGPAYTEICRHLTDWERSPSVDVIDAWVTERLAVNVSVRDAAAACRQDAAAYTALQVEQATGVNVSEVLDLDNYGALEAVDALKQVQVRLPPVELLSPELERLLQVAAAGQGLVDFTAFYTILESDVVTEDLERLAEALEDAAAAVSDTQHQAQLRELAGYCRSVDDAVWEIHTTRQHLYLVLHYVEDHEANYPIADLTTELSVAQESLDNNGDDIVNDAIDSAADDLYDKMDAVTSVIETNITEDIGSCEPVFLALSGIVQVGCGDVLDPFNAFWLCYGWSLWALIPALVAASSLAGIFRAQGDKGSDITLHEHTFDNSSYHREESLPPPSSIHTSQTSLSTK